MRASVGRNSKRFAADSLRFSAIVGMFRARGAGPSERRSAMSPTVPEGSSAATSRRSAASLSPADLARLLSAAGARHVSAESILRDAEAGAPTNADGTMHLVHYGAWLARQAAAQDARTPAPEPESATGGAHGH